MLARGHYKVKSKFIDDDKAGILIFLEFPKICLKLKIQIPLIKEEHACWEWAIDIAKDWAKK